MSTVLDKIVASKRQEIENSRRAISNAELERRLAQAPPVRDFRACLEQSPEVAVIAEVKKASPSAGVLRADFDPVALPVLRKDFILDRYQLLEARVAGADAVLLIAEILEPAELVELLKETHALGMQALLELYDKENLARVVGSGGKIIGINNRDLRSFVTRLEHTLELATKVPKDRCLVSESGIRSREDVVRLQAVGVKAVLIGETFMRAPDIGSKLAELRGQSV